MQISPIKAFFVLLVALAAIAAVVLMTRPASPTIASNAPPESPDYSLTNEEAITRFKELKELRDRAYRTRNPSIVRLIYTSDSPVRDDATSEIRQLLKDRVLDRTQFITRGTSVISNASDEIKIHQRVDVHPKITNLRGRDITTGGTPERRQVEWTLRPDDGDWLVFDTLIVASKPLRTIK